MSLASFLKTRLVPAELDQHINRIRKPIGSLGYEPWGYNNEAMKYGLSLTKQIYEKYFRVQAHGVENIPADGPVLIIANHSGQLPIDGLLIGMGADMHTASLFPGEAGLQAALDPQAPVLLPVRPETQPETRVSFSARVLNEAVSKHLLITGTEKREALERARHLSPMEAPIRAVLDDISVHWAE